MKYRISDVVGSALIGIALILFNAAWMGGVLVANGFLSEWIGYDFGFRTFWLIPLCWIMYIRFRNFFPIWQKHEQAKRFGLALLLTIPLYINAFALLDGMAIIMVLFGTYLAADHSEGKAKQIREDLEKLQEQRNEERERMAADMARAQEQKREDLSQK